MCPCILFIRSPHQQHELSEYTPIDVQGVSVASNPAYEPFYDDSVKVPLDKLPPNDSFYDNNQTCQDYEPFSKVLEDDHEYDYIPATFTHGRQQRPLDGSARDDYPTAKKDGVPQISFPSTPSSLYETPMDW